MQCARYAFGFSGVTDEDEAADTPGMRDVTPRAGNVGQVIDPFATPKAEKAKAKPAPEHEPTDISQLPDAPWGDEDKEEGDLL
jgi:hypothetical protein